MAQFVRDAVLFRIGYKASANGEASEDDQPRSTGGSPASSADDERPLLSASDRGPVKGPEADSQQRGTIAGPGVRPVPPETRRKRTGIASEYGGLSGSPTASRGFRVA